MSRVFGGLHEKETDMHNMVPYYSPLQPSK